MILMNPGGPGHSGVEMVIEYGSTLQVSIDIQGQIVPFPFACIYLE